MSKRVLMTFILTLVISALALVCVFALTACNDNPLWEGDPAITERQGKAALYKRRFSHKSSASCSGSSHSDTPVYEPPGSFFDT